MGVLTYTTEYTLIPYPWCILVVGCFAVQAMLGRSVNGVLACLGEDPLGIRAVVWSSPESEATEAASPTGHYSSTDARSSKASSRQARKSPPPDAATAEAAVSSRQQQAQRPAASSSTTTLLTFLQRDRTGNREL